MQPHAKRWSRICSDKSCTTRGLPRFGALDKRQCVGMSLLSTLCPLGLFKVLQWRCLLTLDELKALSSLSQHLPTRPEWNCAGLWRANVCHAGNSDDTRHFAAGLIFLS